MTNPTHTEPQREKAVQLYHTLQQEAMTLLDIPWYFNTVWTMLRDSQPQLQEGFCESLELVIASLETREDR